MMKVSPSHNFGRLAVGEPLVCQFCTYDAAGASVTVTDFDVTSIKVVNANTPIERASSSGYSLIDTDGIDMLGTTGIHGFTIATGDDDDPGFYATGQAFYVTVEGITVDGSTINAVVATFELSSDIVTAEAVADAVWDESTGAHDNGGTFGALVGSPILDEEDGIETGLTLRQAMRGISAVLFGKISGAGSTTETVRNAIADDADRLIYTVDAFGNRTDVTPNL